MSGSDSQCRRTSDRLTPFVDEALPPAERADVEQHLDACPPCRRSAEQEQGGRAVLRERAQQLRSEPLPPGLRTRCAAIARAHATTGAPPAWRSRVLSAALGAALVLVAALAILTFATPRSNTLLAAQLTADHAKCFRAFPPPGGDLDARVAEERLSLYGWDVHVPPSSPRDGIRLVGARRCLYGDGRVPHLLYDAGGYPLSLFVIEGVSRPDADVTTLGHRSRIWSRGPTTFVLVSPASAGELAQAVSYVRQEAH